MTTAIGKARVTSGSDYESFGAVTVYWTGDRSTICASRSDCSDQARGLTRYMDEHGVVIGIRITNVLTILETSHYAMQDLFLPRKIPRMEYIPGLDWLTACWEHCNDVIIDGDWTDEDGYHGKDGISSSNPIVLARRRVDIHNYNNKTGPVIGLILREFKRGHNL